MILKRSSHVRGVLVWDFLCHTVPLSVSAALGFSGRLVGNEIITLDLNCTGALLEAIFCPQLGLINSLCLFVWPLRPLLRSHSLGGWSQPSRRHGMARTDLRGAMRATRDLRRNTSDKLLPQEIPRIHSCVDSPQTSRWLPMISSNGDGN